MTTGVPSGPVLVDIRAEDIHLSTTPSAVHRSEPAMVTMRTFLGAQERIVASLGGVQLVVERPARAPAGRDRVTVGTPVFLDFDPALCRLSEPAR